MGTRETISIDISPDLADIAKQAISGGEFASMDQIVRAALDDWMQRRERDLIRLRGMLADGIASGSEPHDGMDAIKEEGLRRLTQRQS